MKLLSACYLLWVLLFSAFSALLGSDAATKLLWGQFSHAYPNVANTLHIVIFVLLFVEVLLAHLRVPAASLIFLANGFVIGTLLLIFHFVA